MNNQQNTRRGNTQTENAVIHKCHSRGMLSGMRTLCNKGAFTLIELLVVVLIIGILAAVALPQYQKAVLKSRYETVKAGVSALAMAQEIYYLEHGEYSSSVENLGVDWEDQKFEEGVYDIVLRDMPRINFHVSSNLSYSRILQHQPAKYQDYAGLQRCRAENNDSLSIRICRQDSGLSENNSVSGKREDYFW